MHHQHQQQQPGPFGPAIMSPSQYSLVMTQDPFNGGTSCQPTYSQRQSLEHQLNEHETHDTQVASLYRNSSIYHHRNQQRRRQQEEPPKRQRRVSFQCDVVKSNGSICTSSTTTSTAADSVLDQSTCSNSSPTFGAHDTTPSSQQQQQQRRASFLEQQQRALQQFRQTRCVTFAAEDTVALIPNNDVPIDTLWYTAMDYQRVLLEIQHTNRYYRNIAKLQQNGYIRSDADMQRIQQDNPMHCARGLERRDVTALRNGLWQLIARERHNGAEALGWICQDYTKESMWQAQERGQRDALAAR